MHKHKRSLLIAASVATLLISTVCSAEPIKTSAPNLNVMKVAHRGVSMLAPENTIPAIQKAIDMGLDYVELDVRYTKDGVEVLMHDSNVDRTTDGSGYVRDMTLEEIKKLDAGEGYARDKKKFSGTRVPTLKEALETMKGKLKLYLDQKEPLRDSTIEMLREYGMYPDNMVITGSLEKHSELRSRHPDAPVMPSFDYMKDLPDILKAAPGPKAFNTDCVNLTKEMVDAAHEAGVLVFTNTLGFCESRSQMRKVIMLGPDAIQTDMPDELLKTVKLMKNKAGAAESE